jgi:hypothetical protein
MEDSLEIFKEEEIHGLPSRHPLRTVALSLKPNQVCTNTQLAVRMIASRNPGWLEGQKHRLLDITDWTNASSALGEVRAYGSLLETWMNVAPGPTLVGSNVSPEFEVDGGDGTVIVEVHTRQLNGQEARKFAEHLRALESAHAERHRQSITEGRKGPVITSRVVETFPFGAPDPTKPGDSVQANAISKIASIKPNEHQSDPSKPFVLWLDLQDETVWPIPLDETHFSPLYSGARDGGVGAGTFWFALYGKRGDPLPETLGHSYRSKPMGHDGRFQQTKNGQRNLTSAVVFSLPRATVLMEHPDAIRPLPPSFRAAMLKAPFFRADLSLLEWKKGVVSGLVTAQRSSLLAAVEALSEFDP